MFEWSRTVNDHSPKVLPYDKFSITMHNPLWKLATSTESANKGYSQWMRLLTG